MFSDTFKALLNEAQFTREVLGTGATQIRKANYSSKGIYFQAFTSLSTGLERIGKLCLMLDHYVENEGKFPDPEYMQRKIGHNLALIYTESIQMIAKYSISIRFLKNLNDPIHQAILLVLSNFALGDRYSNIDLVTGGRHRLDPITSWFKQVDRPLYETRVSQKKRNSIKKNSEVISSMLEPDARVLYVSETGEEITDVEQASYMTGVYEAVAPYRQLYVLQIIRYWAELLGSLHSEAMKTGSQDLPYFPEIFAPFYNEDSYIRTRKTWDEL